MRRPIVLRLGGLQVRADYCGNVELVGFDGTTVRIEAADLADVANALLDAQTSRTVRRGIA